MSENKSEIIFIRLGRLLRAKLKKVAEKDQRTMSHVARKAVEQYVRRRLGK